MKNWIPCEKELLPVGVEVLMYNPVDDNMVLVVMRYEKFSGPSRSVNHKGSKIYSSERMIN